MLLTRLKPSDYWRAEDLWKIAAEQLIHNVIHQDGGPLIHHGSEEEQRSFDTTCRKFHRFLTQPHSTPRL